MKLVKNDLAKESQITNPTQFPQNSQMITLNQKLYKGIKVSVNFGKTGEENKENATDESQGLNHLSGGQKTVVVIALIFSVLKMEAAPFYILDEFDHALDAGYRTAIAHLVDNLSANSQFLITTFKPELLSAKAKIFEVTFKNRKS